METREKLGNDSTNRPNWYRMLQRASVEAFKKPLNEKLKSHSPEAEDGCRNSSNPLLAQMEAEFLERLAELLLKKMPKEVNKRLDELLSFTEDEGVIQNLIQKLEAANFNSEAIKKFALSFFIGSSVEDNSLSNDDLVANLQEKLFTSGDPTGVAAKKAKKVGKVCKTNKQTKKQTKKER